MTSAAFRDQLFSDDSGEVIVLLLTIQHPQLATTIRLSSDNATLFDFEEQTRGTVSRGQRFAFLPMDVQLPEQGDELAPAISVTLYDVAMEITPILEASVSPAFVTAEIVTQSNPDEVEVAFALFRLTSADIQGDNVRLGLVIDGMSDESYPADNFTPSGFPGLWNTY